MEKSINRVVTRRKIEIDFVMKNLSFFFFENGNLKNFTKIFFV